MAFLCRNDPIPADGHVMAGAITFEYGDLSGGTNWLVWVIFGLLAVIVIGVGVWFSFFRPVRAPVDADSR